MAKEEKKEEEAEEKMRDIRDVQYDDERGRRDVNVTALLLILPRTCCCCPGDRYPSLQNGRRPGLCNMPLLQGPCLPKELL